MNENILKIKIIDKIKNNKDWPYKNKNDEWVWRNSPEYPDNPNMNGLLPPDKQCFPLLIDNEWWWCKSNKDKNGKEIRKGAIALCSLNKIGLITSEIPLEVTYNDGNKGIAWVGIQLTDGIVEGIKGDKGKKFEHTIGSSWMSKNPIVLGYIENVIENLKK